MPHRSRIAIVLAALWCLHALSASGAEPLHYGKVRCGKVLFLGNSITLHGPAEKIGWSGNWGMAASRADKDYVALVTAELAKQSGGQPQVLVRNIADFERNYETYDPAAELKKELALEADLIIVAIGENVPALSTAESQAKFAESLAKLLKHLQHGGKPTLIVRGCFWPDTVKDGIMQKACLAAGGTFVDISALGKDEANFARAERKIEHAGVGAHPGDKGMQAIAEAIGSAIAAQAAAK